MGWSKERTEHPSNLQAVNSDCHARTTIGVSALPLDAAVEVEGMFEVS